MPSGIHHVTSIASSARRNLDFYERTLGLRRVKKTVNFDDPGSYHLYYGDAAGHPGTILTFFAWEGAAPGRLGIGETQETVFSVPEGSIGYGPSAWSRRASPTIHPPGASAQQRSRSRIKTGLASR
jgi:glyoxalase family protein